MNKKRVVIAVAAIVIIGAVASIFFLRVKPQEAASTTPKPQTNTAQDPATKEEGFDKTAHPIDQPGSLWWVVNKQRPLPAGYIPPDLNVPDVRLRLAATAEQMQFSQSATAALKEMFAAAVKDDVVLVFGSGYRSEALQTQFYNSYVSQDGQAAADRYSARPGTSEHQTGLSFDVTSVSETCHLEICFEDGPEGMWVAANSYKYGFIIRYPNGKEPITGYQYEPWHLRYVGVDLATEMHNTSVQTLEEFFGLPAAPNY